MRKPKALYAGATGADIPGKSWPIFVVLGKETPPGPLSLRLQCEDGDWLEFETLGELDELIEALEEARGIWQKQRGQ